MGIGLSLTGAAPLSLLLAWFSLVPLFLFTLPRASLPETGPAGPDPSVRSASACGALTGAGMSLITWIWLPGTIAVMSRGKWGLGIGFLGALTVFWAACFGLLAAANAWIGRRISARAKSSAAGYILPWAAAGLWVLFEYAYTLPIAASGFTFLPNLGYGQWSVAGLIQLASLTGVFGVSFLIVLVNASLAVGLRARRWGPLLPALGLLALVWGGGWLRVQAADRTPPQTGSPVRVAVLQGDIQPFPKFERTESSFLAHRYLDLARKAVETRPNLVIWTESAVPWALEEGDDLVETALKITQPAQACHLVGTLFRAPEGPTNTFHNTAFLVLPDGQIVAQYHKMRLIPLAELPVSLPGMSRPVCALSGPNGERLVPGPRLTILNSPFGQIGVTICNENFYADMTRSLVRRGADLLVTIGNDGWCRGTVAHRQHFAANAFRAVEAGRDIVVANNSGISGIVDAFGRVLGQTEIHQTTCFAGAAIGRRFSTFYSRHGDTFVALCLALLLVLPILIRIPGIRR
jgi:apolipoprotein N-acyltransferase